MLAERFDVESYSSWELESQHVADTDMCHVRHRSHVLASTATVFFDPFSAAQALSQSSCEPG